MKLIRTKGRAAQQTAEILAALEVRGGAALDAVLPAVKRIVADVRKQGDRALLRYAAQFDGLAGADVLRVTPNEMAAAWEGLLPRCVRLSRSLPIRFAPLLLLNCQPPGANLPSPASPPASLFVRLARWAVMCPAAVIRCLPRCL